MMSVTYHTKTNKNKQQIINCACKLTILDKYVSNQEKQFELIFVPKKRNLFPTNFHLVSLI